MKGNTGYGLFTKSSSDDPVRFLPKIANSEILKQRFSDSFVRRFSGRAPGSGETRDPGMEAAVT